jgi:hypothetical protein
VSVLLLWRGIAGREGRCGRCVARQLFNSVLAILLLVVGKVLVIKVITDIGCRCVGVAGLTGRRACVCCELGVSARVDLSLMGSSLETLRDIIVVFARATTSDLRALEAGKSTVTDSTLAVACESILSGETVAAGALVGLVTTVYLCVTLQVVLSDEALAAVVALELAITKMGLDVGTNVLLAAELLVAPIEETGPLAIAVILGADEALNILG